MIRISTRLRWAWLWSFLAGLLACASAGDPHHPPLSPLAYLDQQEALYEEICVQMGVATWAYYTGEGTADLQTPRARFQRLCADPRLNTLVFDRNAFPDADAALQRRLQVWRHVLTIAKVTLDPEALRLQERLEAGLKPDVEAQARPTPEAIEQCMIDLVRRRNALARVLGYRDFPTLMDEETELGARWLDEFIRTVESVTREPYRRLVEAAKAEKEGAPIAPSDIRALLKPYYADPVSEALDETGPKDLNETLLQGIGLPLAALPIRLVVKDLPPGIGGQGFAIRIPTDIRIVVQPDLSPAHRTHEYGHAVQYAHTRPPFPILKGYEWMRGGDCEAFIEGMAQTLAFFQKSPAWIAAHTTFSPEEIQAGRAKRNVYAPANLRSEMAYFLFERELYRHPDQPPRQIQNRLHGELLLVEEFPDAPVRPDYYFIFATYPAYVQSYLLADIVAWQVHQTLQAKFGDDYPFNPQVGPFLEEAFWKHGSLDDWRTKLVKTTGRELDVSGYLRDLGL